MTIHRGGLALLVLAFGAGDARATDDGRGRGQPAEILDCKKDRNTETCVECGARPPAGIACCWDSSCEVVNEPPKGPAASQTHPTRPFGQREVLDCKADGNAKVCWECGATVPPGQFCCRHKCDVKNKPKPQAAIQRGVKRSAPAGPEKPAREPVAGQVKAPVADAPAGRTEWKVSPMRMEAPKQR